MINGIERIFACVVQDKRAETLTNTICSQIASNSKTHTDKLALHRSLQGLGFQHGTVCHKYQFINREENVDTQAVASFHSEMKVKLKREKE